MTIDHLVPILQSGSFTDNLFNKPAANLDELRQRAKKFIEVEEFRDYHNHVQAENDEDKGKKKDKEKEKERNDRHTLERGDKYKKNRKPRFYSYNPLNTDREKIMDEALNTNLIPKLRKLEKSLSKFGKVIK